MIELQERTEYYTVDEVAAKLRVHRETVKRLCQSGQLRAKKIGRIWRISQRAIDEYMGETHKEEDTTQK